MNRIRFPIPLYEREMLQAAGEEALTMMQRYGQDSAEYYRAHSKVDILIGLITAKAEETDAP